MEIALNNVSSIEFNDSEIDAVEFNGLEVWRKQSSGATVTREVNFVNNTKTIDGDVNSLQVYQNMGRCNVADDGTINAYYGDAGYTEDGSNGQVMVKVPKFYYKLDVSETGDLDGVNIRHGKWSITDSPSDGFKLHPAFIAEDGITELDYFLYGAFEAVGQNSQGNYSNSYIGTSYKLSSVSGYNPIITFNRKTSRTMATNRGTNWFQAGIRQTMAIQMLFVVEYGFNSQLALGKGITSRSGTAITGGTTGNISSGDISKDDYINYRGIENLWGNVSAWIDGLNMYGCIPYICNTYDFVDKTDIGYTRLSYNVPTKSSYVSALGYDMDFDWVLLPSEAQNANANSSIGDYVNIWNGNGWLGAMLDSMTRSDPANCGLLNWKLNIDAETFTVTVGARLMYIPQT